MRAFVLATALCCLVHAQWTTPDSVVTARKTGRGLQVGMKSGAQLRLEVCASNIVHVVYAPDAPTQTRLDYVVIKQQWPAVPFQVAESAQNPTVTTDKLIVSVARDTGAIIYSDPAGKQLMQDAKRILTPAVVNGEKTSRAEAVISMYGSQEALYGLGQHQAGVFNYRGESIDLSQENTNIAVPLLVSSNGYGVFWNNTSRTRVNNRFIHSLYFGSEVADAVDYYFIYGPALDKVIAGYRELTGDAPMFGQWAYGFWQSKNRYQSQNELLDVAEQYRARHIPVDNIVQDWFWWTRKGEHRFNLNFPDPAGMVKRLHEQDFHLMLSVWPFFERGSSEYEYMRSRGWFVDTMKDANPPYHTMGMALYDATNAEARKFFWGLMDRQLFSLGVDAWWLDTDEPETEGQEESVLLGHRLAIGSGDRYANIYPLMHTSAIYEGQRRTTDRKRVFILSRSAFAGSQRNAVTAWSGDVLENWETFKRQVPAGLNFSLSGLPYWTTDIGGFISGGNLEDPVYRELFVRWFEYGAFCPIFRTHGTRNPDQNEVWSYGPEAEKILVAYDHLRYQLMPYTYSLAWMTTHERYTPMRPLVMDYPSDVRAQNTGDEFLYGPSLLIGPVTEQGATTREMYFPQGPWTSFWTGEIVHGPLRATVSAPLDRMPVYVRAGAIIPFGPEEEYAGQHSNQLTEVHVYPGADGAFTFYQDDGTTYDYEKGQYATVSLAWDDVHRAFTIGSRHGTYSGMPAEMHFRVAPLGYPAKQVDYTGAELTIRW